MSYFLWGCRGILTLITLRSERVKVYFGRICDRIGHSVEPGSVVSWPVEYFWNWTTLLSEKKWWHALTINNTCILVWISGTCEWRDWMKIFQNSVACFIKGVSVSHFVHHVDNLSLPPPPPYLPYPTCAELMAKIADKLYHVCFVAGRRARLVLLE